MNKVNELVICKDNFHSQEDFENAIKKAVMVLLDNRYIMTVRYDEPGLGIVCIDFDYEDQSLDAPYPYWLTYEQWEKLEMDEDK
jgi:hypothetical protein